MNRKNIVIIAFVTAGLGVHAATMDFRHSESNADGFFSWTHPANWGGTVPGAGDLARLRQVNQAQPYLKGDIKISSLNIGTGVHGDLAGFGALSVSQYLNFDAGGAALNLRDKVSLEVGNRTRLSSGLTTVTLHDAAKVRTKIAFDEADAQFLVTLNGGSVLDMSLHSGARNIGRGSRIVLNDTSSLLVKTDTVLLLYENWIGFGVSFHLNGRSSLHLKPAGQHDPEFIAMFIESGGIVINGRTSAAPGTDYTYDPDTGVLQVR